MVELQKLHDSDKLGNHTITLCWNVLRVIAEQPLFIPQYLSLFENQLVPLFRFLQEPAKIEFDDDILLIVTSLIKGSKTVTRTQLDLFTMFPAVFVKYNHSFCNLLQTLNLYIVYGRDVLASDIKYIEQVSLETSSPLLKPRLSSL